MAGITEVHHVPCVACGCTTDDVTLRVAAGRIVAAEGACARGEAYFKAQSAAPGHPAALIAGHEAPLDSAVAEAARLLAAARYPLVYGFTQTTAEAQRVAVRLADLIGANIDTTAGPAHGAEALALQAVGRVTCTLGEVKNRADLVIYWGCNPAVEYPHHFSRYSRAGADLVLPVPAGQHFALLQVLRALAQGRRVHQPAAAAAGIDLDAARTLVARMKGARFGIVFFGAGLSAGPGGWANVAALHALAADLHQFTRFYALGLGGEGNAVGAEGVLSSETAFPFAVNLSRGYPRYGPGEFTARELLSRGEADLLLAVTADPVAELVGA
ncbi:MAG: formylmethanofuran dehydrogenase, subunit, partial [Firmicutes bacterium]|nr:formylmethanofuran dehydrogenase, subunit [Bacillota bacterium]